MSRGSELKTSAALACYRRPADRRTLVVCQLVEAGDMAPRHDLELAEVGAGVVSVARAEVVSATVVVARQLENVLLIADREAAILGPVGHPRRSSRRGQAVRLLTLAATDERRRRMMYARVARFEGGDPGRIDEQVSDMKAQMDAARSGNLPAESPEQVQTLMEVVTRFLQLVDRRSGASVGIAFFETEDDMRRADAALNEMSPPDEAGRRTSVEMFEVGLDESFR